jgi:hypothetical protein
MPFWPLIPAFELRICDRQQTAAGPGRNSRRVSRSRIRNANLVRLFAHARFFVLLIAAFLLVSSLACAQDGAPAPRPSDQFSFMQLLADKGLH